MFGPPTLTTNAFAVTSASRISWLSARPVNAVASGELSRSVMLVLSRKSRSGGGNRSSTSPTKYSATDLLGAGEPGDPVGRIGRAGIGRGQ